MKRWIASLLGLLLLISSSLSFSQGSKVYSQAELDRMLAPIALYPDPLLSQVLMASTYPIEVVEAARWTRANPGLRGDDAVRAVAGEDWDPSVKSLAAFPQILQRMDENLEWTRSLGDAFLAQQPHVMDTVQQLRQRAHAAGNLQSSEHLRVEQQDRLIFIQPVHPEYVHVPYYDPYVVYGPWWWPAYRPVAWAPWPGYARPGVHLSFWWGAPVAVSSGFFFGNFDWHRRHVRVVNSHAHYYRPPVVVTRTVVVERDRSRWHHDPHHRRGVDYRHATVRQEQRAVQAQPQVMPPQPQVRHQAQPQARPQRHEEEREKRRQERRREQPAARDLQDSKVLTPQAAPPRPQQEERWRAREEKREQRQEARQDSRRERRETRPERGHAKGHDRS